ncbi:MAG: succinate dehydrogenase flavoprotein subunit [Deltaproteobacteria bacterium]|nr:succinate dehydrogenase flavoprotein subunit [Deltaproteobacteria bacterium]
MANDDPRVIVVGGGLAGLTTVIKLCEAGKKVDIFSFVPVKRSHSVCAQGGINGAVNTKGEGDHPEIHFVDTIKGGDYLAEQPLAKGMCYAAPKIIYLMDRMGVPFNRTAEGLIDFRRFGGTLHHRTAFAGATTGQQLLYALDEQVRKYESEGLVRKFEFWEFLGLVKDGSGVCRGIVAMDIRSPNMEIRAFRGEAVALCTGGPGLVYGRSTNSIVNTGTAAAVAYTQGARYANGEFIQFHPTAIPGLDKLRLISESIRGEGGRVWVPRTKGDVRRPAEIPSKDRWYFLEERYPKYQNLVPRDVASREIYQIVYDEGLGVGGRNEVFLDITHIPADVLNKKVGGVLEIYERFVGEDPRHVPMRIFPAMHYSMGGLWVTYEATYDGFIDEKSAKNQATNIPGLYAVGEVDHQYHGANRLGANSLLSCIYGGMIAGPAMAAYAGSTQRSAVSTPDSVFDGEARRWQERFDGIRKMNGAVNPFALHQRLGEMMTRDVSVRRYDDKLKKVLQDLGGMMEEWKSINVLDTARAPNQTLSFVNQLWNMLELAKVITKGALQREECRGAHYKPDLDKVAKTKNPADDPEYMRWWNERNEKWTKTTIAVWTPSGPELSYEDVPRRTKEQGGLALEQPRSYK